MRDEKGRFIKGISGNPSGKPPVAAEVKEMFRNATIPAVQLLIDTINDIEAKQETRIRCAEIVLDRMFGKAVQPLEAHFPTKEIDLGELTVDELRRLAAYDEPEEPDSESSEG